MREGWLDLGALSENAKVSPLCMSFRYNGVV